jgi:hypothetical protein
MVAEAILRGQAGGVEMDILSLSGRQFMYDVSKSSSEIPSSLVVHGPVLYRPSFLTL